MPTRAKELRFSVDLTPAGELRADTGVPLDPPAEWSPEHLLLAALVRCSLESLRHHARRRGLETGSASGTARTLVTKRETDGRYALVAPEVELAFEIQPAPDLAGLAELLARAERDCFVGASFTATPRYRWQVNGRTIDE